MKRKKGVIRFQSMKTGRVPLTREEYEYWYDLMPKILKIGTEFEDQLPSTQAILTAADTIACVKANNPCVESCANLETCLVERHPSLCLTRASGKFLGQAFKCPAENAQDLAACAKCEAWALHCRGLDCSMHTPYCTICPSFQRQGTKAVENNPLTKDPATIRKEVKALLQPTGNVGHVGKSGALEVKEDGSLVQGGIEIPTVGRRVHWQSFYKMCKGIIDTIVAKGAFVDERCGQHYHILAGYFNGKDIGKSASDLEIPMPEIILANLHQLCRRYELAMFWMTSAGTAKNTLTRWAKFRMPISRYSALNTRMSKMQKELAANLHSPHRDGKYAAVAYHFCKFNAEGDLTTFHIENRIPDGCLSPAVVTAWAMMFYAMVLKAVRLSQHGLMEAGDAEYMEKVKGISPALINGWGSYDGARHADTSRVWPHVPFIQENARELVQLLKPELLGLGEAYNVLLALANEPVSIRRVAGDSWEKIENDLYPQREVSREASPIEGELRELVDLTAIVECQSLQEWIEEIAAHTGRSLPEVVQVVEAMVQSGEYYWSGPVGALITA